MNVVRKKAERLAQLRKRAEDIMSSKETNILELTFPGARKKLHELHTYQIELELQNEELRLVQEELEKSRCRFSDLYDFAPVGYLTISEKGLILEANLTAAALLGEGRGYLLKQPLSAFIVDEDQDIQYYHRKKLLETKKPQTCELRMRKKDGSLLFTQLKSSVSKDVDGSQGQFRTVMTDISERKRVEEELEERNTLNKLLLDSIPHPAMIINKQRIVIAANKIALEVGAKIGGYCWQGFGHVQYISEEDKNRIDPSDPSTFESVKCTFCLADKMFVTNEPQNDPEIHAFDRIWDTYWLPLGKDDLFLHYAIDMTELNRALGELEKRSDEIKHFAYSVVHDLKNPAIANYHLARILSRNYGATLDGKAKQICEQISKGAEQMIALVEKINVFINAREALFAYEDIDVAQIMEIVRENIGVQLNLRQIELSVREGIPLVRADKIAILRLFNNLIDNSIKYGGEALSFIRVDYQDTDTHHILSVYDDGVGLNRNDSGILLDRFKRGENLTFSDKTIGGLGLGLAIIKEIVANHDGEVWIDSDAGKGVTFFFSLSKNL